MDGQDAIAGFKGTNGYSLYCNISLIACRCSLVTDSRVFQLVIIFEKRCYRVPHVDHETRDVNRFQRMYLVKTTSLVAFPARLLGNVCARP